MTASLVAFGVLLILLVEGSVLAELLLGRKDTWLAVALSLPLAALVNVLLTLIWTVLHVPLTPLSLIGTHFVFTIGLIVLRFRMTLPSLLQVPEVLSRSEKLLIGACSALLAVTMIYAFAHAVLLPTFQFDSANNWTMRSQISFYDHAIAFDPDENRGMAKPQYPFLFHALQITANQGQVQWNDTIANTILFLLSICSFSAVFLMHKKLRGTAQALTTITLIIGIPLMSVHLAQGYGDINLVQYLLLSLVFLAFWIKGTDTNRSLMLSGIFVAAGAWTKSEGLFFGVGPWLLFVALSIWLQKRNWKESVPAVLTAVIIAGAWQMFAIAKGLALTPHSSDTLFGFRPEGVAEAFYGLFSRGSFGIAWYVIIALTLIALVLIRQKSVRITPFFWMLLAWGWLVLVENLFIYLMTPNVRFLLNAESYYRQMMIPAAMIFLALGLILKKKPQTEVS